MRPLNGFFIGRACEGRHLRWPGRALMLTLLLFFFAALPTVLDNALVAHAGFVGETQRMELRVDTVNRGRVMYNGFQLRPCS